MAVKLVWLILTGSLYLLAGYLLYQTSPLLSVLVILVALMHLALRGVRPVITRAMKKRRVRRAIKSDLDRHIRVLARKREELVRTDDYGLVRYEDWEREKDYFIGGVILPHLSDLDEDELPLAPERISAMVDERIDGFMGKGLMHGTVREYKGEQWDDADQHDYRKYCELLLGLSGWKIQARGDNHDPDMPIMAEKEGRTFVVTCIRSSSPVGSTEIRHALRVKRHSNADMGAVVTNVGYSRLARWVSSRCKVLALHHEDLSSLE